MHTTLEELSAATRTETGPDSFRRLRRLRMTETLRSMVRETTLSPKDFIYPLFVVPGSGVRNEVKSMPGVFQRADDRTFVMEQLTSDARDAFMECMLTSGIGLKLVAGKGGSPTAAPEGENPGMVEFEW